MSTSLTRKQAAIMFTDIAGYTKAMSTDEDSALMMLYKKRTILQPLIRKSCGTFVKEIGDGTLSYFKSGVDAATCAVKLQQATYDDSDLNIRIGVHSGQVLFESMDVFGDVVNIAARLESIAPVGGICVSKVVFDELLNEKQFDGVALGLQKLKGIGRLIDVFALKAQKLKHPDPREYETNKIKPHTDDEIPSVAILPLKNMGREADAFYAYGITSDLITDISRAGKIRVASMKEIDAFDLDGLSAAEIAGKLRVRYIVNGTLWKQEGLFQLSIEVNDSNNDTVIWHDRWQEPWEELTTIKGKLSESLLKVLNIGIVGTIKAIQINTEAYEFYLKGKYKFVKRQNVEDTEIARGLIQKAIKLDDTLLQAKNLLGWSYYSTGDYENAMNYYEKALTQAQELGDKTWQGGSLNSIGAVYYVRGDLVGALDYYIRALGIRKELGDDRGVGQSLSNIGVIYSAKDNDNKALDYYNRALVIKEELGDKPGIGLLLNNIGIIYFEKQDFDKALNYYSRALEIREQLDDKQGIGISLLCMGRIYSEKGDNEKALDYEIQALEVLEELGDKRAMGWSLDTLGNIYHNKGQDEKALDYRIRSHEIKEELGDKIGIGFSLSFIGQSYFDKGNYDKALDYYTRSLLILEEHGNNKRRIGAIHSSIGCIYYNKGEYDQSIVDLKKSIAIQGKIDPKDSELLLETTTYLFLTYKQLNKTFNQKEIYVLINEAENIEYELYFRIFGLLEDTSYLEAAHKQVAEIAHDLGDNQKFLNYPVPKAIIAEWGKLHA